MGLTSGKWKINGNGFEGELEVTAPANGSGPVAGRMYGNPIGGFWDDDAQRLTVTRSINPGDPSTIQVYTGYQFRRQGSGPDATFVIAGSFEAFAGTGATAQRTVYGWTAEIFVIG